MKKKQEEKTKANDSSETMIVEEETKTKKSGRRGVSSSKLNESKCVANEKSEPAGKRGNFREKFPEIYFLVNKFKIKINFKTSKLIYSKNYDFVLGYRYPPSIIVTSPSITVPHRGVKIFTKICST